MLVGTVQSPNSARNSLRFEAGKPVLFSKEIGESTLLISIESDL
jgi:hypothetical protein